MEPNAHYSNKDYKRLGDRIRQNPRNVSDTDFRMLQELRLSYKEPLAVIFHAVEQAAHKVDANSICTYRVKRIESIVSKLLRFPEMQINRTEDIAGCRCIMTSTEDVYRLYDRLLRNKDKLPFELKGVIHDYIQQPKESGYRSIHLNAVLKDGDNRRVEIQLRSLEHHNWATLVEITDLLFKAKLKEDGRADNHELFDLHLLLSKDEGSLSKSDKYKIAETVIKYNYIEKLGEVFARNYLDVRSQWNKMHLQRYHFFLISTDSTGIPEFSGYLYFEEAEKAYFEKFLNNRGNRNIVLAHLKKTDFTKISIAYSNYFLTFNNTIIRILHHLSEAVVNAYKQNKVKQFSRYYQSFLDIIGFWMDTQLLEVDSFKHDKYINNYVLTKTEWRNSIRQGIDALNYITRQMHRRLSFSPLHLIPYYVMKQKQKHFRRRAWQ